MSFWDCILFLPKAIASYGIGWLFSIGLLAIFILAIYIIALPITLPAHFYEKYSDKLKYKFKMKRYKKTNEYKVVLSAQKCYLSVLNSLKNSKYSCYFISDIEKELAIMFFATFKDKLDNTKININLVNKLFDSAIRSNNIFLNFSETLVSASKRYVYTKHEYILSLLSEEDVETNSLLNSSICDKVKNYYILLFGDNIISQIQESSYFSIRFTSDLKYPLSDEGFVYYCDFFKQEIAVQYCYFLFKIKDFCLHEQEFIDSSSFISSDKEERYLNTIEELKDRLQSERKCRDVNPALYNEIVKFANKEYNHILNHTSKITGITNSKVFKEMHSSPNINRLYSASKEPLEIIDFPKIECQIKSTKEDSTATYTTSLDSCTCTYFQKRHKPCKHMYFLALQLGSLSHEKQQELLKRADKK